MDQGQHTLVFTDLVDSTRLTERVGDARARELFAAHDRAARALLASLRRPRGRSHRRVLPDLRRRSRRLPLRARLSSCARRPRAGGARRHPCRKRDDAPQCRRGCRPGREADRGGGPRQGLHRARDGARPRRPDIAERRGACRPCRGSAPARCAGGEPWPLPAEGCRGAGRDLRAGRARRIGVRASGRCREGVPRRACRRFLAAVARGPSQPARRARCVRRPDRGTAGAGGALRRRRAPRHRSGPGRYGQDTHRPPLRLDLARRLARRRLLLRSLRRALARRDPLRRRVRARSPARSRRSFTCTWAMPSPDADGASSSSTTSSRWSSTLPPPWAIGWIGRPTPPSS